jgi:hypothetical protein
LEGCDVRAHYDELVVVIDELGFNLEVPFGVFRLEHDRLGWALEIGNDVSHVVP